jgi:hypothetical protein
MNLLQLERQVELALEAFRRCQEREAAEYGQQYDEVKRMEDEAPAPDPCAQFFNELIEICMRYVSGGGDPDELELGEYRQIVYSRMDEESRWEGEGGRS